MSLDSSCKSLKMDVPPQGFVDRGYQSVLWSAHDDNDDELIFAVYYRGEGGKSWRLLKDKLAQRFYSWDTTTMPDGAYYLKLVASDSPSNPPGQALTNERTASASKSRTLLRESKIFARTPAVPAAKITFDGISSP